MYKFEISPNIRHISFDMWNTLISANTDYAAARTEYLADHCSLTLVEAKTAYSFTKHHVDRDLYQSVANVRGCHEILAKTIQCVNKNVEYDVDASISTFNELFVKHPPVVLPETIVMLQRLIDMGISLSITSNTNFISGEIIQRIVDAWNIPFSFSLYSDLLGYAKPDPRMFNNLKTKTRLTNPQAYGTNIMHIGDDMVCDHYGASSNGLVSLLIKNPRHLVELLG